MRRVYRAIKAGYLGRRWDYTKGLKQWQLSLAPLFWLHPGRRADLDFKVLYLTAMRGGDLLDVGCGNGELIERMEALGWRAEGVDIDGSALRVARQRGLNVRAGTLESQEYPADSFDAVTISHVIEHVHDPVRLLRACYQVLRPGGRLVVVTPNASSWAHRRFKESWLHLDPPRHLHLFTPPLLQQLAEMAGFQGESVSTNVRDANGVFIASRSIERTGRYTLGSSQSHLLHSWSRVMQLVEWMMLKLRPDSGEEIALIGKK